MLPRFRNEKNRWLGHTEVLSRGTYRAGEISRYVMGIVIVNRFPKLWHASCLRTRCIDIPAAAIRICSSLILAKRRLLDAVGFARTSHKILHLGNHLAPLVFFSPSMS